MKTSGLVALATIALSLAACGNKNFATKGDLESLKQTAQQSQSTDLCLKGQIALSKDSEKIANSTYDRDFLAVTTTVETSDSIKNSIKESSQYSRSMKDHFKYAQKICDSDAYPTTNRTKVELIYSVSGQYEATSSTWYCYQACK